MRKIIPGSLLFALCFLLFAWCCLPVVASAQPGGTAPGSGSTGGPPFGGPLTGVEGPIISESYLLMPGDLVLLTISGSVTYSYSAWITYEGKLTVSIPTDVNSIGGLSVVDVVLISGLNLKTAQDSLGRVFNHYFKSASVKLTLTAMRTGVVFVTGEVAAPGAVYASPVERISQVIAKAGGLTTLGSRTKIQLFRNGRPFATVNLERFENQGDLASNPFVESGDRIYVPAVTGMVTVKGAIFGRGEYRLRTSALTTEKERIGEGMYELNPGERVMDFIKKAGGVTPWADLRAAYIMRRSPNDDSPIRIPVDVTRALYVPSDTTVNITMQNDDVLILPPVNTLVYVEGEVVKPGAILYTPNLKFNDYLGMAGGPTNNANFGSASVTRNRRKLSTKDNLLIEPGDIIFVPRQNFKWWQDYLQIFSSVAMPVAIALLSLYASGVR